MFRSILSFDLIPLAKCSKLAQVLQTENFEPMEYEMRYSGLCLGEHGGINSDILNPPFVEVQKLHHRKFGPFSLVIEVSDVFPF